MVPHCRAGTIIAHILVFEYHIPWYVLDKMYMNMATYLPFVWHMDPERSFPIPQTKAHCQISVGFKSLTHVSCSYHRLADGAVPRYSKNASSTAPPRTQFKLSCSIRQISDWTYPRPRRIIETRYNFTGVEPSLNTASL